LLIVSKSDEAAGRMAALIAPAQLERRFVGGTSDAAAFDPEAYLAAYAPAEDGADRHHLARANAAFLAEAPRGEPDGHWPDGRWGIRI
jgi:hypothetical protein